MSYAQEQATIRKLFLKDWDSNTTPVKFSGEPGLTKGNDSIPDEKGLEEWVRVTINTSGASQRDLAGPESRVRYLGVVTINVFVKSATGAPKRARQLMDLIDPKFSRIQVEGITFQTPLPGISGETEGFYQMTLQMPFYRDSI